MDQAKIKALFKLKGVIYTRQRAAVYDYLERVELPQTAAQIAQGLEREAAQSKAAVKSSDKPWLSTVYRCLELFREKGLLTEFRLPQGEALAYFLNTHAHRHYAVCTRCNAMLNLNECPLAEIEAALDKQGFRIASHRVEIYGLCKQCAIENDG